jgi:glycyl-tRNA synthetase
MAFLCNSYNEEKVAEGDKEDLRVVMKFNPKLAPIKAAVFPLVNKDGMPEKATAIFKDLQKNLKVEYDTSGAVGRRYRRQDEIGTPFCITVDGESVENDTVTIRNRDTMLQDRINSSQVYNYIRDKFDQA